MTNHRMRTFSRTLSVIALLLLTGFSVSAQSVQIRRGLEANLPTLLPGQLAFTTDTHKLFCGQASGGNFQITASGPAGTPGTNGTNGTNGAPGSQIYVAAGVPASSLGVNGDFDLNSTTGDVYTKSSGTWSLQANLKGPTGATGSTGAAGSTGSAGATGPVGPNWPIKNAGGTLAAAPTSLKFGSGLTATASGGDVTVTVATSYVPTLYAVVPSGTLNGTNMAFTLPAAPLNGTVLVFLRGQLQSPGSGAAYTLSGTTITFTNNASYLGPQAGDSLYVIYNA